MSNTSTQSYVRTEMLSEKAPPVSNIGIIGWMKENLFSSPLNALLSIVAIALIVILLSSTMPWILGGVWNASSLTECRLVIQETVALVDGESASRACWGVVHERFWNLIYGFYPGDLYWRPNLALVLLFASIAPILFNGLPKKMLILSGAFIFIGPWLLWGGPVWTPIVAFLGFAIGFVVNKFASKIFGSLIGIIVGVVVAFVWWLFLAGTVSQGITHSIAAMRLPTLVETLQTTIRNYESELEKLAAIRDPIAVQKKAIQAKIDAAIDANAPVEAQLAKLRKQLEALGKKTDDDVDQIVEQKKIILDSIAALMDKKEPVAALIAEKMPIHLALLDASGNYNRMDEKRRDSEKRLELVLALEGNQAKVSDLAKSVSEQKAALPATVSSFGSMNEVTDEVAKTIPSEDIALLKKYLNTKDKLIREGGVIDRLYDDIGLVGLEPVQSRDFGGFMLAILLGITGIVLSFPLGIVLALGRLSDLVIIKSISVGFIEFIRGVPLITLLFVASALLNFFLPKGTEFDIMLRVMIMITIFAAAYMAEVIRGGLAALPKGQYEAADALGLDYWQAQRLIIMPQALKISIPGIVSTFIGLFKDTTLVSVIAMSDPIQWVKYIQSKSEWNGVIWELYGFVAFVFFLFCFSMSRYSMYLERKLQTGH